MTNTILLSRISLVLLMLLVSACATKPVPEETPYLQESADQFMQAGIENFSRYHYEAALNQFVRAEEIYARYADEIGKVNAELNISRVLIATGQYAQAIERLQQLEAPIKKNQLQQQMVYRDIMLSSVYLQMHDFPLAAQLLAPYEDYLINNTLGVPELKAALLINRVRLADAMSQDFDTWLARYEEFVASGSAVMDYKLRLYRFKAKQLQLAGNVVESDRYFSQALDGYRQAAEPVGVMSSLLEWADACVARAQWTDARDKYQLALETALINSHVRIAEQALFGLDKVFAHNQQLSRVDVVKGWMNMLKNENGLNNLRQSYNRKVLD